MKRFDYFIKKILALTLIFSFLFITPAVVTFLPEYP